MPPVTASGFSILLPSNHVAGRSQFAEEEEQRVIDDCILILWLLEFVSPILKDLVRGFIFGKRSLTTLTNLYRFGRTHNLNLNVL